MQSKIDRTSRYSGTGTCHAIAAEKYLALSQSTGTVTPFLSEQAMVLVPGAELVLEVTL
jgi:hypothetical protein